MHTRRPAAAPKLGDPCSFLPPKLSYFNEVHTKHHVRRSKAATAKYIPYFVTWGQATVGRGIMSGARTYSV